MSQGNQKSLVQFCLELGSVVNEILDGSDELLSALEELFDLYQPRSREEAKDFMILDLNCQILSVYYVVFNK